MKNEYYTFDDVLIVPQFSAISSRRDVDLTTPFLNLKLPVISSNMDTITGPDMCIEMRKNGGIGCLHRFWNIDNNVQAFMESGPETIVSFGVGEYEKQRVIQLQEAGAKYFCLDVAHGAQNSVVDQTIWFKETFNDLDLMVGNFASVNSLHMFCNVCPKVFLPDAIKVGIGNGSACTTRLKTGVGFPQLSCIQEFKHFFPGITLICDGGVKTPGDIAKALAAGADAVMTGYMLAGTDESAGKYYGQNDPDSCPSFKYRGSASQSSYYSQNKNSGWRTAEGESFEVPYKGKVQEVLHDIEGGLRSAFTYVGASNLKEFRQKSEFIRITNNSVIEGTPHGKKE